MDSFWTLWHLRPLGHLPRNVSLAGIVASMCICFWVISGTLQFLGKPGNEGHRLRQRLMVRRTRDGLEACGHVMHFCCRWNLQAVHTSSSPWRSPTRGEMCATRDRTPGSVPADGTASPLLCGGDRLSRIGTKVPSDPGARVTGAGRQSGRGCRQPVFRWLVGRRGRPRMGGMPLTAWPSGFSLAWMPGIASRISARTGCPSLL